MAVERAQILEAAVRVLVEDPAASMQAIADAAGIGRATLHRAFPGRQDLLRSIALTAAADAERLVAAARPEADSARAALARVVAALVPIGHRYSFLGQEPAFATDPEIRARTSEVDHSLDALFARGQREGTLRADVPLAWVSAVFDQLLFATWRGVRDGYLAPLDAPRVMLSTLLGGLGPSPDARA